MPLTDREIELIRQSVETLTRDITDKVARREYLLKIIKAYEEEHKHD